MSTSNIPHMTFEQVWQLIDAFNLRFPDGNTPFQLVSRLAEECGEVAEQVNAAEIGGIENRFYFAKEIEDVIRATLTIARYYDLQIELTFEHLYGQAVNVQAQMPSTDPYYAISALSECLGKTTKHVNHAEGMGRKKEKYGELDCMKFAQTLTALLLIVAVITRFYHLEDDVQHAFRHSYQRMTELGFISPPA